MSGDVTDRDERAWQRRAEERIAPPWGLGRRLRRLRAGIRALRRRTRVRREPMPAAGHRLRDAGRRIPQC
ncbi:hypothetical protein ACGF1Z_13590 [Streptomyces sp. NPDC048018]|uniref:hypothetical protein n=1 Tax=Streptomyces sp. NPDC048018 TaxID=3365499 RepID=UPI00371E2F5A